MSIGFGTGPFGTMAFGAGEIAPPHGRVYAKVIAPIGLATLAAGRTGSAALATNPRGLATLSPKPGFATLQTD